MMDVETTLPGRLTDDELTTEVRRLARTEREATAALVAHLAEFEARRLHLAHGFPSLFMYCTEVLRLSEHETYNRIEVARLGQRFPRVLVLVGEGALNLTTARLLSPHLSADNEERLLAEASYKSKREVEEIIVRYVPRPDVPSSVRKVATRRPVPAPSSDVQTELETPLAAVIPVEAAEATWPAPQRREVVRPLAPDRYEIRFTATAGTCEKLRIAKDLLRHAVPDGDIAEVVDRALTVFLEELARKKFAATPRPRPNEEQSAATRGAERRHIPASVKRTVWLRDGGRCAFVGKAAHRCEARGFLEFHHVRPYGVGGLATTDNIQIRCRAHNGYEADLFYGRMESEAQRNAIGEPRTRSGTS